MLAQESLTFDQCDQHHCPQERSSNESGDLTGGLKQIAVFDLKCLFPNVVHDLSAAVNDGVGSEVQGDSKKSQSQDNGQSNEESGNDL